MPRVAAGTPWRRRPGSDAGFAMSSPLAAISVAAVVLAGVGFLLSDPEGGRPGAVATAVSSVPVQPQVTLDAVARKRPALRREDVFIDVYNNSNVTGLAAQTSERIAGAGWQVVGSDNWYGTIPATTIYYPERLEAAARLLSRDLGIERVLPAVDPMNGDRLTLILTADFA